MDKFECTKILKLKKTPQTNHRYKNNTCNTISKKELIFRIYKGKSQKYIQRCIFKDVHIRTISYWKETGNNLYVKCQISQIIYNMCT